ncbi:MAG: glycoside hydrolase family 2 TIM barrel-domain containing protein, partial [Clostridia bacterium]
SEKAVVAGDIELENNRDVDVRVCANIKIKDASGKIAVERNLERFLEAKQKEVLKAELDIKNPIFWDIDDPHQYTVVVEISVDGEKLQEESVKIGVRTCVVDVEKGFYLNGRNIKVYGACLHHDGGLVGAAVPDDVWRRRLSLLKDCGCNAIRTSHNPYSEDFLDLCDEMGFLVQAEFYDEWDYAKDKRLNCVDRIKDYITRGHDEFFQEYAKSDLQVVVKRDRNHPSIFQWSLGNEIEWAYPRLEHLSGYFDEHGADWGSMNPPLSIEEIKERIKAVPEEKYEIGKTANKLADWTREMDITRPITSNCVIPSASYHLGYTDALDIVGYSHRFNIYDYGFENYPNKHLNGCETGTPWYEYYLVQQRDYISALFVWTGISYMGEAHSKDKTQRGSNGAFVDFAGFKRDSFYVAKSWWEEKPMVFAATVVKDEKCMFVKNENGEIVEREEGLLWDKKANQRRPYKLEDSWTYKDGDEILVEAYSNCDEVTLYINGKEQGTVLVKDHIDKVCRWIVPYEAGEIKAVAKKGNEILEHIIKTASEFAKIAINCDKEKITTDFDSVAHIEVMLTDKDGTRIPKDDRKVSFVLEGAYINMGVDNGSAESFQHYKNDSVVTSKGRALMIVQGAEKGTIKVKAMVDDIVSDTIEIEVE